MTGGTGYAFAALVCYGLGDFIYKRATAASKLAFEASRAKGTGDLKTLVAELRTACNACHASYLKTQ